MYCLPNAKINIGLRVVACRPDGYHDLQTVFYPLPLTDSLEIKEASNMRQPYEFILSSTVKQDHLSKSGEKTNDLLGNDSENLVVRVFLSLREEFSLPPTSIFLSKHIPIGAGLGGGSSDAAFMMQLLNDYYRLGLTNSDMERRLAIFGADCPFFVRNKPVYAEGIGNKFSPIELDLKGVYVVLVKPDVFISTAEAYAGIVPRAAQTSLADTLSATPLKLWRNIVVNDFETSVFARYPQIAAIKQTLYDMGALYASMSGSGSAVYGLYSRPIDNAAKVFPDCFTFSGQLR